MGRGCTASVNGGLIEDAHQASDGLVLI